VTYAHQFATAFALMQPGLLGFSVAQPKAAKEPRQSLRRDDAPIRHAADQPSADSRQGASTREAGLTKPPAPRKLLSYSQLGEQRGITYGRRHLYTLEATRKFPRRVSLGEGRVGWVVAEIDAWLQSRLDARDV
jgi:prophage regulatory protein